MFPSRNGSPKSISYAEPFGPTFILAAAAQHRQQAPTQVLRLLPGSPYTRPRIRPKPYLNNSCSHITGSRPAFPNIITTICLGTLKK